LRLTDERTKFLLLAVLFSLVGCAGSKRYLASRSLDLWDVIPFSAQRGGGLAASVRITPFAQTGLGWYNLTGDFAGTNGFGMGPGRWGPRWYEGGVHLLLFSLDYQEQRGEPWPGGPDGRYQQLSTPEKTIRSSGNFLIFLPGPGAMEAPPGTSARIPRWYFWPDCEAQVFVIFIGLRVGLSPAQLVDFLAGIIGLDPLGDDLPSSSSDEDRPAGGDGRGGG
jgi:hypothetical protein